MDEFLSIRNQVSDFGNTLSERGVGRVGSDWVAERSGERLQPGANGQETGGKEFTEVLKDSLEKVNSYQVEADQSIKNLIAGRTKNVHETLLAIERAEQSFKLMMQVRNKVLDAYREVMRMQV